MPVLGVTYEVVWTQTGGITCQTTDWSFNTGSVIEWLLSCVSCTNTLELTLLLSQVWQEALSPCAISMRMSMAMSKFHKHTSHTILVCTKWYAPFFSHTCKEVLYIQQHTGKGLPLVMHQAMKQSANNEKIINWSDDS